MDGVSESTEEEPICFVFENDCISRYIVYNMDTVCKVNKKL